MFYFSSRRNALLLQVFWSVCVCVCVSKRPSEVGFREEHAALVCLQARILTDHAPGAKSCGNYFTKLPVSPSSSYRKQSLTLYF